RRHGRIAARRCTRREISPQRRHTERRLRLPYAYTYTYSYSNGRELVYEYAYEYVCGWVAGELQHELRHRAQHLGLAAADQQAGDRRLLPLNQPLLDALDRADQRDLVGEAVGHHCHRLPALALHEEVLNLLRLRLVAHARHELLVKVALLGAHAADVEAEHRLDRIE